MKKVIIVRLEDSGKQTIGHLSVFDGKEKLMEAKTLELPDKNNARSISCIPRGTYLCKPYSSKNYPNHYEVKNVPNRSHILFHEGNFNHNTEGCILMGKSFKDLNRDGELDVTSSVPTFEKFNGHLDRETFLLQII
ncbi:DUF5675 family protein [Flammeovirga aprica]|uniref:DUF5675 domain-containing protein n=1 Tax=Flammeovirga aprica JL-4 TaxID=694437 RepID=A0A7X9RTE3_9BACT|nr:DUF5675 family protein [Flammeovirga aprica]NME67204.1 hypothetical protein [Flammeovirga aprica JL-4]